MNKFALYHTDGCHLCEQAHSLLVALVPEESIELREIMDNALWLERFQISIPVVENPAGGALLYWPFDAQQLQEFIEYGSDKNR